LEIIRTVYLASPTNLRQCWRRRQYMKRQHNCLFSNNINCENIMKARRLVWSIKLT